MQAVKEATPEWPKLDPVEDKLLQTLTGKWNDSDSVSILDLIKSSSDLSESTIQRRLATMQTKGVIKLSQSTTDGRYKLVHPTQLTIDYFEKLAVCLKQV